MLDNIMCSYVRTPTSCFFCVARGAPPGDPVCQYPSLLMVVGEIG